MSDANRFIDDLPELLRRLSDPVTPYTAIEVRCRIDAFGWDECVPCLMQELGSGEPDEKRLVMDVLHHELVHFGSERVQRFVPLILPLLDDADRLVRTTAIQAVRDVQVEESIPQLRRIVCDDERPLAAGALVALMELDDDLLDHLIESVRDKADSLE